MEPLVEFAIRHTDIHYRRFPSAPGAVVETGPRARRLGKRPARVVRHK